MADSYVEINGLKIRLHDNGDGTFSALSDFNLLANILGEVQAAPTANTVLDRLLSLATLLTAVKDTDGIKKIADAVILGAGTAKIGTVDVDASGLPSGAATEAKQDALLLKDFATQTTLAALLAQNDKKASELLAGIVGTDPKTLTDLATILGEVSATPTANTLLARLKAVEDNIAAMHADGVQLSGSLVSPNNTLKVRDSYSAKECKRATLTPNSESTQTFTAAFEALHVLNYGPGDVYLDIDSAAAVGGADDVLVLDSMSITIPLAGTAVHLIGNSASVVQLIGYRIPASGGD